MVNVGTEEPSVELLVITKYIVQVYCPMWIGNKRSGRYKDAPKLLHITIKLAKKQSNKVQRIVFINLQGNLYCWLQENFVYCMKDEN